MKALIVDDKEENLYLLETMLKSIGYETVSASNGAEALEKLNTESFDLIVSDILMPVMDGYQLCREVKKDKKLKDIPFVFYTATYTEEKDEEFSLKLGVCKFIRKPCEPAVFIKIIQDVARDAVEGKIKRAEPVLEDEKEIFKTYSERLINKLEKKMLDLEESERELRRINRALKTLSGCNQVLIRAKRESDLLNKICRIIVDTGGYRLVWVGFAEQDKEKTVRPVAQVGYEDGYLETVKVTWADNERGRGPTGTAIRTAKPVINRNVLTNPDYLPYRADALKRGYASSIALPLIADEQVIGALNVYAAEPEAFDTEEVKLLTELADDMAFGIMALRTRAERKKAEEELRKKNEFNYALFNNNPIQTVIVDRKGRITDYNLAKKKSGDRLPEFGDTLYKDYASGHDIDMYAELMECIKTNKAKTFPEQKYRNKVILITISPFSGGAIVTSIDITERKQMEQMLLQSEKMASIGTIAAGVAHEINNPIGYIDSNLKTLEKYNEKLNNFYSVINNLWEECSKEEPDEVRNFIDEFMKIKEDTKIDYVLTDTKDALSESLEGTEKVKKIVSDLKDFSRSDKPEIKLADINDGIEKTLNIIRNELKYKAEVIKEFGEIPELECDIKKLEQVFMNILVNAAQAIEEHGIIKIKTFSADNSVVIQISDTGKGMPKENIGKIFDAFFTTKEPGKGTGLGLSISYKIIEEHNGIISVESEVGKGTTFTIKLPVKKYGEIREYKMLIVDDEEDLRKMLKEVINEYDPSILVKTAKDGFEAGDKLNTFRPDVVLLDIKMPGIDGLEVCRRIRIDKKMKNTKVIMITGFPEKYSREECIDAGADEFLIKPIEIKTLYGALNKIIKG